MALYRRFMEARVEEALEDSPVVLLHGARQCGKTTLAQMVGARRGYEYITFDNDADLAAATSDPIGFVDRLPAKVVLDEVQRVPTLFLALKAAVDRERRPGRFILTGSTNILLLPTLSDSLAGRMEILRLHPLSQDELRGRRSTFLDRLFSGEEFAGRRTDRLGRALADVLTAGGYPAALARATASRRSAWYRDYVETLVQRDVRDLSRIHSLDVMPRLLQVAASQTARTFNVSSMASAFTLSRPTIQQYVTVLERLFLLEFLQPWFRNRLSRLIKTPKLHVTDVGTAASLLNLSSQALDRDRAMIGQLLESFVHGEVRRQAGWFDRHVALSHYRDKDGYEVDLVVESDGAVAGIEVKAAATVHEADFRGLRKLQSLTDGAFTAGVILYDGTTVARFGERFFALPLSQLWEG